MATPKADIEKAKEIMSRLVKQPPKTHDEMVTKPGARKPKPKRAPKKP